LGQGEDRIPGEVLAGKYRLERLIGRGGMGAVFAATDLVLGRRVAVKTLLAEGAARPESVQRFFNEARAAAQIESEHVVRVLDVGASADGTPFIVLELLEGSDLAQLARQRAIDRVEVVDYVLQALEALAQAHARGIVHRDLKPANLFVARRADGASLQVKILDFGISKMTLGASFEQAGITSSMAILGSPAYMSPEQLRSAKRVDARSDVWSVGVILYELLTGRTPFVGDTVGELFAAVLEQAPPPLRSLRADIPPALDAAVLRCLAQDPARRFQSVSELASALAPFASPAAAAAAAPILATLEVASWGPASGSTGPARRGRGRAFAVAVGAAIVAVAGSLVALRPHRARPAIAPAASAPLGASAPAAEVAASAAPPPETPPPAASVSLASPASSPAPTAPARPRPRPGPAAPATAYNPLRDTRR
jgi:serine/threonine-protein kinase